MKEEYKNLFLSFKNAWNACKSFLGDQGTVIVPFFQDTRKKAFVIFVTKVCFCKECIYSKLIVCLSSSAVVRYKSL